MKYKFATLLTTLLLVASCSGNNPTSLSSSNSVPSSGSGASSQTSSSQGQHSKSIDILSGYLVKDGITEYSLVYPSGDLSTELIFARDEFVKLFKEATGISINAISDEGLSHNANNKYISVGQTNLYKSSNLPAISSLNLKDDGYVINTVDKTIYMSGISDVGTLYSVYQFLEINFNFDTFTRTTYYIDTNVMELPLMNYNVKENPDIDKRARIGLTNPSTSNYDDKMYAYRIRRLDQNFGDVIPIHKTNSKGSEADNVHNSFHYFEDEWRALHPKTISDNNKQMCFTAHGDKAEYQEMVHHAAQKVENSLTWYDKDAYKTVQVGINDEAEMCNCDYCKAQMDKHLHNGTRAPAATLIPFIYDLGKEVYEWMQKPENEAYKRDLHYTCLMYQSSLVPPIQQDAQGNYYVNPELRPYDYIDFSPMVAVSGFTPSLSIYSPENATVLEYMKAWGSVYKGCKAWSYGTFFNDFLCFYDATSFYSGFYKELAANGYTFVYEQIHSDQRGGDSGFNQLYMYVYSKLAWDTSLDIPTLIDKFLRNVYDVAYEQMKAIYDECKIWFRSSIKSLMAQTSHTITNDTRVFNQSNIGFVNSLMSKFTKAYEAIAIYEKNVTLYNKYKESIDMEWLFPAKIILSCYKDSFKYQDIVDIYAKFKNIIEYSGLKCLGEFNRIQSLSSFLASMDAWVKENA